MLYEVITRFYRLLVRDRDVFRATQIMQVRVFRPDTGIIQPRGDGIDRRNLTEFVLTEFV